MNNDLIKILHNQAKDLVAALSEHYDLRNVIKDDAKYCEILYNLTNNFVKTSLATTEYLIPFSVSNRSELYKLCNVVTETTAKIIELNIRQIKESHNV